MGDLTKLKELGVEDYVDRWSKYDATELKDKLTGSSRAAIVTSADGLLHQVDAALQYLQQSLPEDDAELSEEQEASLDTALTSLKVSAQLCGELLAECHAAPPEALLTAAMQLHDHALLELGDVRPDVQDAVAKLCCSWWTWEADNREFLVSQALPYLLLRAISTGKASQVKACYVMRGALELLDFEDASINDMKRMLLQAAICPAFVSRPEGRKFLSCLLTVHPSMVQEMTSVIRNQIPAGRWSVLDAYGEVILRGWREAVGACLPEIENSLIQNLMIAALHGSSQSLVSNIRRVLGELHRSKKLGGVGSVDGMLVRLYEPILFRGLAAANAGVRRNALQLLLDAFPLLDPEASTEEQDEMLVRQFQCLSDALTDPCPLVRVAAAQGICSILNLYWEIIPSATTAGYVSRLTGQLAFDATLPAVRVAVLEGLQLLVDNQHAQPVLKRALPQLAPLMWDSSPRVREAMTDLLLCISTSRGLHFWEVVPLDVLLGQLAAESQGGAGGGSAAAQKLHQLLVPSYFPGPEEGVARVAALLKEHPAAGQAFCRLLVAPYLHYIEGGKGGHQVQVPLEDILSLASSLAGHLLEHAPVSDPGSPPRKTRSRRGASAEPDNAGAAAAAGKGGRVKRKKAPSAAAAGTEAADQQDPQQQGGGDGGVAGASGGVASEVDVMAVGAADETPESWARLLAGLSEICAGIGVARQNELCGDADLAGLFPSDAFQQLLAACPTPACEACVWAITQALPHTPAATALLSSRLEALAVGSLLPPAAAAGAGADEEAAEAHAASVLACLAAGPCGGRLSAMLCSALGVDWADSSAVAAAGGGGAPAAAADSTAAAAQQGRSRAGSRAAAVLSAAARASGPDGGAEQGDDVACMACGSDQGGDRMMLCDGCDAALHMDCLQPPLDSVPEGDWLCPGCCAAVRDSDVPDAAALQYLRLLLLSDSGRALLLRSGALKQAVPLLQSRAGAAAAAGVAAAGGWQHREDVLGALQAVLLYARAAVHLLSQGVEEEPALLARGAVAIVHQVASTCSILKQLQPLAPVGSSSTSRADGAAAQQQLLLLQLLTVVGQLQGLLSDVWSALKLLGAGCLQGEPAVAAAAAAAATAGHSLLLGLAAVGEGAQPLLQQLEEEQEGGVDADGPAQELRQQLEKSLALNTHLLRVLISLPAQSQRTADQQGAHQQQQHAQAQQALKGWLLAWLQLLSTSPLATAAAAGAAVAAAAAHRDLPVVLAALLPAGGRQQPATAASAGSTEVAVGMDAWLPVVVQAAAGVQAEEDEGEGGQEADQGDSEDDAQSEGDQASPAARRRRRHGAPKAGGRRAGPLTVKTAATKLGLPALVTSLLATAQQKQVHTMLSARCLRLAISSGQQGDWPSTLGALRLSKVLGAGAGSVSEEQAAQLQQLRQQAVQDNGTAAHLFCEALGSLLPAH